MKAMLSGLRILLVEDEPGIVEILSYDLLDAFPNSEINVANTVRDAHTLLNEAYDANRPYDVAIFDFKLPESRTEQHPESDFSLPPATKELFPDLFMIQISAYVEDIEIQRFLRNVETHRHEARMFIAKEAGWIKRVIEVITGAMHTRRVRDRFEELFRRSNRSSERVGLRGGSAGRSDRARSLEVAALCADAAQHWESLSPPLQADLERVLGHAQDERGKHYVGVVKRQPEDDQGGEEQDLAL